MAALFERLGEERDASVKSVLGHWMFGYVHPFPDGNGRTARFLMNVMLASGGYPWTVIRSGDRQTYLQSLESASAGESIVPFARFVNDRVCENLREADISIESHGEGIIGGR